MDYRFVKCFNLRASLIHFVIYEIKSVREIQYEMIG